MFRENKLVAFYTVSIIFVLLFAVLVVNTKSTISSQARQSDILTRGCYYKLSCPPRENGIQSAFRCEPVLVCPTPTLFPKPTAVSRPTLSCNDCTANRFTNLCFDPVKKASYCATLSPDLPPFPNLSCVSCDAATFPTPTPANCTPPPACLYSNPRCLIPEPADGWCQTRPTPYTSVFPLKTPTCRPLECPVISEGCTYLGGDGCTTCGKVICNTSQPESAPSDFTNPTE